MEKQISKQTLQRMPMYLNYLKSLPADSESTVSARIIANALGLVEIQVRKDLASVSNGGRPKVGYVTLNLIKDIENFLGYNDVNDAILVGAGKLGKALLSYKGFREYGLNIVAAFDSNEEVLGKDESGIMILPLDKIKNLCERMKIKIGIITVPQDNAQEVCDLLVESNILAIWNFAPVHLNAPSNILIKNENMAVSLAMLSMHLNEEINS